MGIIRYIAALLLCCVLGAPVCAGVLAQSDVERRFPAPYIVGPKEAGLPVWPIFRQNGTATELAGYAFESIDLAPIPGFAGVPMNLLVAIDPKGEFIDVSVLSQHEPVFLDGLGEEPLFAFARQYRGLSLRQDIAVASKAGRERGADANHAWLDGVAKATASVRILNQSVLSAALQVARKKLGFAQGRDPDRIARIRAGLEQRLSVPQMLDAGLIRRLRVRNSDVEKLFAGGAGAGLDPQALAAPDDVFIDFYLAWVSVPAVGRSLLTDASWNKLKNRLDEGDHAFLAMSSGRYSITGDDFVRGSVPDRLALTQDKLPIGLRDLDMDLQLADPRALQVDSVTVLRVIAQAGLDPGGALAFSLPVTRAKGIVYPERISKDIALGYKLPAEYLVPAAGGSKGWRAVWIDRLPALLSLAAALVLLAAALALQQRLVRDGRRFAWFRRAYLLFTVGYIGYYAQGQLSIVNITAAVQALAAGRGLGFMLFDPMTVLLWAFVAMTLLAWGRGSFCGWLCPFGALQEFTGKFGQWIKLPQLMIRPRTDARLKWIKYALLALMLASALLAPALADMLVELEPFKTAITLNFNRSWPFVAYAVGLLLLSMVSYKFFCRYLCPFGAALALFGRVRLFDWIARRAECGKPCQTCRHRCEHGAIRPNGTVVYAECFQCMDCVVIHASDEKCAPLMLELKRRPAIPIARVAN